MIRNTVLGLVAAAALAATASAASAGFKVNVHFNGYAPYYGGYYGPSYVYKPCHKIFVGYKKIWTYYGWVKKPIFKKACYW